MSSNRELLHDLIERAQDEDLGVLRDLIVGQQNPQDSALESELVFRPSRGADSAGPEPPRSIPVDWTEMFRTHVARVAERLELEAGDVEFAAGGGSGGADGTITMDRNWRKEETHYRLHTFHLEGTELITLDQSLFSDSGSRLSYKLRILTPRAESSIELNVPLATDNNVASNG
jgi:hypothetical protein